MTFTSWIRGCCWLLLAWKGSTALLTHAKLRQLFSFRRVHCRGPCKWHENEDRAIWLQAPALLTSVRQSSEKWNTDIHPILQSYLLSKIYPINIFLIPTLPLNYSLVYDVFGELTAYNTQTLNRRLLTWPENMHKSAGFLKRKIYSGLKIKIEVFWLFL